MPSEYAGVTTRFLRNDERLILSEEKEMPLVIEAVDAKDAQFLQAFLNTHSDKIMQDIATYGAVLLRGFDIRSDEDFEKTVLSIQGFKGISEAFMSEEGRVHVGKLKYVLHTNAVYKTGGTLYLGGFHSENYYTPDVPAYICFCCFKPSLSGGETGIINMEKVYSHLDDDLKNKLEKQPFFVTKWLVSDVADRYKISTETIEKLCRHFDLPLVGEDKDKFILMYKPNVFVHPVTKKRALQINFFELLTLNAELRKCFLNDYPGKAWLWHLFVWKLPEFVLKILEVIYVSFASFFYSPKDSIKIFLSKCHVYLASHKNHSLPAFKQEKAGSCFTDDEVKDLAKLMRRYYSSCLWKNGDILLIDNRKVVHAGMPGTGPRSIRAIIGNPLEMNYSFLEPGYIDCKERESESIGFYMTTGQLTMNESESREVENID